MLQPGDVFAGYAIERLLGQGGMGAVYLAAHPRLPRRTALKLLNRELFSDAEIRARFEREADLVAQLDHPNIVTVYDRGIENEQLWISMQFIDGVDASSVEPSTLPPQRAAQIVGETALALDYAHRMGVLHRDVKPANILLSRSAGQERVLLTDFGIARPREDTRQLTQTGTFTATLAYAAPEQLTGAPLDHRTDQYSLACTLYWLLSGTVPFDSPQAVAVIQGHLKQPPPPLSSVRPGLPPAVDAVLDRALAKRPADRFDSCAEFAAAVQQALRGPVSAPHAVAQPRPHPGPQGSAPNPMPVAHPPRYAQPTPHYANAGVPQGYPPGYGAVPPGYRPPVAPRRGGSGAKVLAVILGLVFVLLAGCGTFVFTDDSTWVSQLTGRSKGHKDLSAMSAAFPGMLPSGNRDTGRGYNGASCRPASEWKDWQAEKGDQSAFDHWQARWECLLEGGAKLAYRFYAFPSAEAARRAVSTFKSRARSEGSSTEGTRTDERFLYNDNYGESALILSTFSDPSRDRWVLTFHGPTRRDDELATKVRNAPL
ncbi:serine/threonine protein kinase [Nocardia amikacinitolerans]|uniref:non-specific serine/threonine protein kinase n=1 Tax=Nocardia amikacinitolerans TaxID=756689 RepID=A0A285LUJ7_9NOCA|nr:serine/threonine-protein kinase [Nocardia amikacinitolerans]SNY88599.1 serine/threonine protein kinase [Nocardia amikacinitolerans]